MMPAAGDQGACGVPAAADPGSSAALASHVHELSTQLGRHQNWFVLTGAGCSTESGIPAYRDESGAWRHKQPIQLADFVRSDAVRRRYWARSFSGFPRLQQARPNAAHHALYRLEQLGRVRLLVTQNVDRLHQKAGSRNVIDLHGQIARVTCLSCRSPIERESMQAWLAERNPGLLFDAAPAGSPVPSERPAPDGDAELELDVALVQVPACPSCGGVLKPDVVFYGETVPPERVRECYAALEGADAVLVVGSSLSVFSGYRFVRRAADLGLPIVVLNSGVTRGDRFAQLKLGGSCGAVLDGALGLLQSMGV